jgi:hypothetical protein
MTAIPVTTGALAGMALSCVRRLLHLAAGPAEQGIQPPSDPTPIPAV